MLQNSFFRALVCTLYLLIAAIFAMSCAPSFPRGGALTPTASDTAQGCPATIYYGSQGPQVKMLQQLLNAQDLKDQEGNTLQIDGKFGSRTEYVVKIFQTRHNLQVDGVVGPKTWAALGYC